MVSKTTWFLRARSETLSYFVLKSLAILIKILNSVLFGYSDRNKIVRRYFIATKSKSSQNSDRSKIAFSTSKGRPAYNAFKWPPITTEQWSLHFGQQSPSKLYACHCNLSSPHCDAETHVRMPRGARVGACIKVPLF
eukprot:jgi/Botrbrau1/17067/Bobra.0329s0003.1